jgi:hypothetical protein
MRECLIPTSERICDVDGDEHGKSYSANYMLRHIIYASSE